MKQPAGVRRRWRHLIVFVLVFPPVCLVLLAVLLQLALNSATVQRRIQALLQQAIPGTIAYDRLLLSGWPPRVHLYGVRLIHPDGQTLITAGEVHATWRGSLTRLPRGPELELGDVSVLDATLHLTFDEQNRPTLPELFVRPGPPDPTAAPGLPQNVRISLRGVEVRNLHYLQEMPGPGLRIEAWSAQVRGDFSLLRGQMSIDGEVSLPRARLEINDPYVPEGLAAPLVYLPVSALQARGFSWRGWGFSIREVLGRTRGVSLRASGALSLVEPASFTGTTELTVPLSDWFLTEQLGGALDGTAQLQGHFFGLLDHAWGTFRASADALQVRGLPLPLQQLTVLGSLDGQQLALHEVRAGLGGGELSLLGSLRLFDGWVQLQAALADISTLPLLPPGPAADFVDGRLGGTIGLEAVAWGGQPLEVDSQLALTLDRRASRWPLPARLTLRADAQLKQARLELRELQLAGAGHRLAAHGWLDLADRRFDLGYTLRTGPLAPLLTALGVDRLGASLSATGQAAGSLLAPRAQAELALHGLTVAGHDLGEVTTRVGLDAGTLSLDRLRAGGAWGDVALDGRLGFWDGSFDRPRASPPLSLTGALRQVQLAALLPEAWRSRGSLDVTLAARGSLRDLHGELQLRCGPLQVQGLQLDHLELSAALHRSGEALGVDVSRLSLGLVDGGGLEGSGRLLPDRTFAVDLRAEGLPLAEIDRVADLATGLSGRATIGLHGEGPLLAPRVSGDLLLRDLARQSEEEEQPPLRLGDAVFHFEVGDDQLLHLTSRGAFALFDLQAELPLTLDQPQPVQLDGARARVAFAELPLERLVPGLAEQGVTGSFSGEALASLPQGRPAVALTLGRLHLDLLGQKLDNLQRPGDATPRPLRVAFDGTTLRAEQVELQSGGRELTLAGRVSLAEDGDPLETALELRAQGGIDLAVLRPWLPDLPRLGGELEFALALDGTLGDPRLAGHVGLTDARFQIAALGQELVLERGRLVLVPGSIELPPASPLVGRLGRKGAFSVTGRVELPRLWPLTIPRASVSVHGERLRLVFPDAGLNVTLDVPALEATATDLLAPQRRIELGGEIRVASGQLNRAYTDPEALATAFRGWFEGLEQSQGQGGLDTDSPLQALRLKNLKLAGDEGGFTVQIQAAILSLQLHLRPDLTFNGPLDALRISGTVETQDGDAISLTGREFQITRSEVLFDGSTSPKVDLEAEAEVIAAPVGSTLSGAGNDAFDALSEEERTYHITLFLKGRLPNDLEKFELSSPQTNDQRELWTLLLFGYRYTDLARAGQGEVGSEVLLSSALQILSQKITEEALKSFRLVDQLTLLSQHQDVKVQVSKKMLGGKLELLGSSTFTSGADSVGSVGAKLYLRERLFLEFSTTPGSEQNPMSGRLGWQVPLE